jgi:peptide/nickel transport system ATP-binding protein
MTADLCVVSDLDVEYVTAVQTVRALDSVSIRVAPGSIIGVVGESGSGKSTLALAIGGLFAPGAHVLRGDVLIDGESVIRSGAAVTQRVRRSKLGFVLQEPISSLDPTQTVGKQLALALGSDGVFDSVDALLSEVGLRDTRRIGRSFPHELSGGMAQRVSIARAIAKGPELIIADEPTSALDVSVRQEILDLLATQRSRRNTSVVVFTHDLRSVLKYCDSVLVMYAGRVVEAGSTAAVFSQAAHPYMAALLSAIPGIEAPEERLRPIRGSPPVLRDAATSCSFAPRCEFVIDRCRTSRPELRAFGERRAACFRAEELLDGSIGRADG